MDYCGLVVESLRPDAVILFGSLARGDFNEGSDVDILVVADFREPFLDRIKVLLDLNDRTRLPLEPVGYTAEEFMEMFERKTASSSRPWRKARYSTSPKVRRFTGL